MKAVLIMLACLGFCGCVQLDKMNENIDRSTTLISQNSAAVEESTAAISANAREVERSTAAIQGTTSALGALTGFFPLPLIGLVVFALLILPSLLLVVLICRLERRLK
jgi:hypothetical protein